MVQIKSGHHEGGRAVVHVSKRGGGEIGRAFVQIHSGRAEVVRALVTINSVCDEVGRALVKTKRGRYEVGRSTDKD